MLVAVKKEECTLILHAHCVLREMGSTASGGTLVDFIFTASENLNALFSGQD